MAHVDRVCCTLMNILRTFWLPVSSIRAVNGWALYLIPHFWSIKVAAEKSRRLQDRYWCY